MMNAPEMNEILELLATSNPKTIFLELAFMESWVHAVNKHRDGEGIPADMLERSMPFLEHELRWAPRKTYKPALPGWAMRVASLVPLSFLGLAAFR